MALKILENKEYYRKQTIFDDNSDNVSCHKNQSVSKDTPPLINTKRLSKNLTLWLGLSILSVVCTNTAHALPDAETCSIGIRENTGAAVISSPNGTEVALDRRLSGLGRNPIINMEAFCFTEARPDADDSQCEGPSPFDVPDQYYVNVNNGTVRCAYEINRNESSITAIQYFQANTAPVNVPIFTPLGIVATISGLLWFGRRKQQKMAKN